MLVLTRKMNEQIQIGGQITITILRVRGGAIRIGIEAPREMRVVRSELPPRVEPGTVAESAAARQAASELDFDNGNLELPNSRVSASAPAFSIGSLPVNSGAKSRLRRAAGSNPGERATIAQPLANRIHARRAPSAPATPLIR